MKKEMNPKTPTPKQPYHHGDLRRALLDAAEAELAEKGVEGFTLRGCAKRAGVSHAAPAYHFKDANALLTALATIGFERLNRSMTSRQHAERGDPRQDLVAAGVGYVAFARDNPMLFKLMFGSERPSSEDSDLVQHASGAFATLVNGVRDIRGDDPMADADGLKDIAAAWSIVHGIANLLIAGRMGFLQPLLERDPETVLADIIERSLPQQ
ncbi:TetR/AcrR family transcriptional regulator [Litchfieldella anticariensis]|nr:TetR/AcrR family transcriptional regulator [Halomonas anticariensis]